MKDDFGVAFHKNMATDLKAAQKETQQKLALFCKEIILIISCINSTSKNVKC